MDGLVAGLWLTVNGTLGVMAWRVSRKLFPNDNSFQLLLPTLILYWALIVLVVFGLSLLHLLSSGAILAVGTALAVLAAVGIAFDRRRSVPVLPQKSEVEVKPQGSLDRIWALGWLVLACVWVGGVFTEGLLTFPTDWDSLMYHIPLIDHWLHARSLHAPDCPLWYNASTNEVLALWIVAPFSGNFLVALNNLPACLLLAFGTLELTRGMGVRGSLAHLTALAVVSTHVFYKQLLDNENDIAVAGLFLVCLAYGVRYAREGRGADLGVAVIALGLMAGIKYYAVGYAAVAWTGLLLLTLARQGRRASLKMALVGAAALVLLCGYWYGRNFWITGTPFYPFGFVPSTDRLSESYPRVWESTFLGSGRPEVFPLALQALNGMAGPVHLAALVGLPFLLGWLVATGLRARLGPGAQERAFRFWLVFSTVAAGLVLIVTPWGVETEPGTLNQLRWKYLPVRFGQCFLGLAVISLGVFLDDIRRLLAKRVAALQDSATSPAPAGVAQIIPALPSIFFAGMIGYQIARTDQSKASSQVSLLDSVLVGVNLGAVALLILLAAQSRPLLRWSVLLIGVALAQIVAVRGVQELASRWHSGFVSHYDNILLTNVFSQIARLEPPPVRLCVMDYRYYPFFGSGRQFVVCRPGRVPSCEWLIAYVRETRVEVLAVVRVDKRTYGRYRNVGDWVSDHPDVFEHLWEDAQLILVRVNHERLAARSGDVPQYSPESKDADR